MANFVVIKGGSQYNAITGRPTLQALRAITSIYHQKVKFPTPNGVGEMKSNQYEAGVTYSDALRGGNIPKAREQNVRQTDRGRSMKVYVDDMLVKSARAAQHITYLEEMFNVLKRYHMKLNPLKCAFGVGSGKFLGFMVSNRGIEANQEKIQSLQDMKSPTKSKEVQRLTGCITALNRFISKATDKCVPFFDALKGSNHFEWTPRCEKAFQKLKEHLGMPPILSKPIPGEMLSLYLSVSEYAVSFVLIRNEERVQLPVYYVSKRLLDAESRYSEMKQLALALMIASRKLRHYFHAHTIQFDIKYVPRAAIKGQALADFLTEFSHRPTPATNEEAKATEWKLYVDGASSEARSGADVMLISPKGHKITSAVPFKFKASNNEAEYEALIAGLRLASHLKIQRISIFSNSQLVVGQVPRAENTNADALAKLASSKDSDVLGVVPIEELEQPTIDEKDEALTIQPDEGWMTPLI
ncbi:uncharacterized protein LOC112092580 [Morus notabilis]|uniref:uncharacterized protein LOC112092580 n=1 Tax=Morus notabilis TaxID=981085 RepID=UPI000CED3FB2|nr:uncharacterized protein LOC112092580 [Morus notabilis]